MGGEEFGERIREESCTSQDRTGYAAVTNIPQCLLSSYDKFVSCLKYVFSRGQQEGCGHWSYSVTRRVEGLSQHKRACQQREGSEGNHAPAMQDSIWNRHVSLPFKFISLKQLKWLCLPSKSVQKEGTRDINE